LATAARSAGISIADVSAMGKLLLVQAVRGSGLSLERRSAAAGAGALPFSHTVNVSSSEI
jgi:hypothetical protein